MQAKGLDAVLWAAGSQQGLGERVRHGRSGSGADPGLPALCQSCLEPAGAPTGAGPGDSRGPLRLCQRRGGSPWKPAGPRARGHRPGKSPGTGHVDVDPNCPQSSAESLLSKACVGPGLSPAGCQEGPRAAHTLRQPWVPSAMPGPLRSAGPARLAPPRPPSVTLKHNKSRAGGGRKLAAPLRGPTRPRWGVNHGALSALIGK